MPALTPSAAERVEAVITASQEMIQEQLDEGLRAIQHTANTLMHEIAAEVWRGAGGDKDAVGSTILHELSRDQAIRALISHSDERFQALAARTGRLEDTMNMLAESIRGAREQLERGADTLAESSPLGIGQLREQLDEMTRQATATYQALAERDQVIAEAVHERIREHGELIARETARISAAMESYVQQGVVAMGNLAGDTDSEIKTISERQQELMVRLEQTIEGRMGQLGEQVRSATDQAQQIGEQVRSVSEHAGQLAERLEQSMADRMGGLEQTVTVHMGGFEERLQAIAAREQELAERLEQGMAERVGGLEQSVAERMGGLEQTVTDHMGGFAGADAGDLGTRAGARRAPRAERGRPDGRARGADAIGRRPRAGAVRTARAHRRRAHGPARRTDAAPLRPRGDRHEPRSRSSSRAWATGSARTRTRPSRV